MVRKMSESNKENESLTKKWLHIAGVVTLYWFVSISLVFLNKYLLSSEDLKLHAPIFITFSQCIITLICFLLLGVASQKFPDAITFPAPEYTFHIGLKVLPLSVVFVSMITFNNLTLKYLGVAFYNVGRSLTTVFNVLLSFLVLRQHISIRVIACCSFIVAGFLLGIKEEEKSVPNLSILGVVCGILASLSVALYSILIKRTLPLVEDNIWRLQMYNNVNALVLLGPLMIILQEIPDLLKFKHWTSPSFWGLMITAGVFGMAIGYVMSLQIKVTTPLTHNVSGTAKACFQTILACIIFSEKKTLWWWMCNFMVLGGSSAYTYVKMIEMKDNNGTKKPHLLSQMEESTEENEGGASN